MQNQLKVLISEDLSCIGQVSMGVTLPILSSLGYNPCLLPTALLSTHTGGFGKNTYLDLSTEMIKILEHWDTLDLQFAGAYFGYLGLKPLRVILNKLNTLEFSEDSLVLVDPVMADNGALYRGFTNEYVGYMKQLLSHADIVTPNVTEAQLLLDEPINPQQQLTREYVQALAVRLSQRFKVSEVVITGVPLDNKIAVMGYRNENEQNWSIEQDRMPGNYFGTGDIFASILLGLMMKNVDVMVAAKLATRLIENAIKKTNNVNADVRFGINFGEEIGKMNY